MPETLNFISRLVPSTSRAAASDPQPPFQCRGVEMLYLEGRIDPFRVRKLLPDWLTPHESGALQMVIFVAPEGWGIAPCTSCYMRVSLSCYSSPDGGDAVFTLAETLSRPAAAIWSRTYGTDCFEGDSTLLTSPDDVFGEGPLAGGAHLSIKARRTHAALMSTAGAYREIARGHDGYIEYTSAYSGLVEPLALEGFHLTLPSGHPQEIVRDNFEPVEVALYREKSFAIGVPRALQIGRRGPDDAAPALIDLIGRLNLPALVFLMDGHLAHVSAAAMRLGPGLDSIVRLVRKQAFLRPNSATFPDRSLPLILQDGQAEVIRLIPLAPTLWGQPVLLCVLADLGRLAAADPVPLLGLVGLTPAEARITSLVARGANAPKVAAQLRLSPHTVRSALKGIYGKLGISSRAELAIVVERLIGHQA